MARFRKDVEAVRLDLDEAAGVATGLGRLGDDVRSMYFTTARQAWRSAV